MSVWENISMEEENNSDGKKKSPPSIPANYISILQLKQRWINEKEGKQKEEAEKRRKKQRIEEDLKKAEVRGHPEDLNERSKPLDRSNRKDWPINSKKKEFTEGGEAKFADKGLPPEIIVAAAGSDRGEDATKGLRGFRRKRYYSKKKKNQHVSVQEDIVDCVVSSGNNNNNKTLMKDAIQVNWKKEKKSVEKERKQKEVEEEEEEAEKGRKEQSIEEHLKKAEATRHPEDLDERRKPLDQSNRKHWCVKSSKKESTESGEARFADKVLPPEIIVAAIGSDRGEDATQGLRGFRRKRYNSKKERKQYVAVEEDIVECGSILPPESNTPMKEPIQVNCKKVKQTVASLEKTVTAIENKFKKLSINNLKAQTSSVTGQNQKDHLPPQRFRMQKETGTMVWVKKEQNVIADS